MVSARGAAQDDANLGASLVVCMLGTLLMMATASFGGAFEQMAWVLAGLCSAYPAIVSARAPVKVREPSRVPVAGRTVRGASR